MVGNPYHALNLSHNPFGELDAQTRVRLACVDVSPWVERFYQPNHVLQLLADHGRGKTTHLMALHQYCPEIAYVKLHPRQRVHWQASRHYFIDSIENLSFWQRLVVYHRHSCLAVTTHTDLSTEMRLLGKQVSTIRIRQTEPSRLRGIFTARIIQARWQLGMLPYPSAWLVNELIAHFDDDIRTMESLLYELYYLLGCQVSNIESNQHSQSLLMTEGSHLSVQNNANHMSSMAWQWLQRKPECLFDWY